MLATGSEDSAVGTVGSGDFCGRTESSFEGRMTGAAGNRTGGLGGGGAFGVGNSLCTILDQVSIGPVEGVAWMRIRRVVSAKHSLTLVAIRICRHASDKAWNGDGRTSYATHMSIEPSRAACSRISSLVSMTVLVCVQICYRRMAGSRDKRRSRNGRMFQSG